MILAHTNCELPYLVAAVQVGRYWMMPQISILYLWPLEESEKHE